MKSTYLYAVLYDIMYDSTEQILYHYVLNLFILLYNIEQQIDDSKVDRQINAVKFDDNSGSVGLKALNRTLHKLRKKEIKQLMTLKSNIKAIKNKIISKYKENALNFNYLTVTNLITDVKIKPTDKTFIFFSS